MMDKSLKNLIKDIEDKYPDIKSAMSEMNMRQKIALVRDTVVNHLTHGVWYWRSRALCEQLYRNHLGTDGWFPAIFYGNEQMYNACLALLEGDTCHLYGAKEWYGIANDPEEAVMTRLIAFEQLVDNFYDYHDQLNEKAAETLNGNIRRFQRKFRRGSFGWDKCRKLVVKSSIIVNQIYSAKWDAMSPDERNWETRLAKADQYDYAGGKAYD